MFFSFCQFLLDCQNSPESIRSLARELLMPVYGVSPFENISHTRMPYDQTSHNVVYLPKFNASGAVHLIGICFMPSETKQSFNSFQFNAIFALKFKKIRTYRCTLLLRGTYQSRISLLYFQNRLDNFVLPNRGEYNFWTPNIAYLFQEKRFWFYFFGFFF